MRRAARTAITDGCEPTSGETNGTIVATDDVA
jgi:hypothetical protein